MKDSISLTIPMDYNALSRASDMLHGMAIDLERGETGFISKKAADQMVTDESDVADRSHIEATIPVSQGGTKQDLVEEIEPSATTVFGGDSKPAETNAPVGVDLDSNGLPWDHRIHGSARKKLAKTQTWKYIRNIDPALIDKVEAELRVTMAASSATPVVTVGEPTTEQVNSTPAPAKPAAAPIVETPTPPATDITFPVLMGRITAGGITTEAVTAACNKSGITALPLLAARPDLVPAVAAELGITV